MSWPSLKATFIARRDAIMAQVTPSQIDTIIVNINRNIGSYANNAGISPNPPSGNPSQSEASQQMNILIDNEKTFQVLLSDVTSAVKSLSSNSEVSLRLNTIGTLGSDIRTLQAALTNSMSDVSTSEARKKAVENPDTNVSWYQGFSSRIGFSKPLHQISIPILMGFGILLLILSGLMLKEVFTSDYSQPQQYVDSDGIFALFTDSRLHSVLGAITLVITVLGILSYNGYMGKYTL
jgi:hypothetical protein